jgi:hypothetical protein
VATWPRRSPAAGRRLRLGAALAAAATAGALALALLLPTRAGGPSVVQAAALSERPAESGPPPLVPGRPQLLDQRAAGTGLYFPNWRPKFRWRSSGARADALEGRRATTVFYVNPEGARVGYTILSGEAIPPPKGARRAVREGTVLHSVRRNARLIVTWLRAGRTCVLSGDGVRRDVLLDLAAWKGKGAVRF